MKKILIYSILLVLGLLLSNYLPAIFGASYKGVMLAVQFLTMTALAYIMIYVGLDFDIDKTNIGIYLKDYLVAATAAGFPWIFVALYFVFFMTGSEAWGRWETWTAALFLGRFAAPTSAGILFAMLIAAGLAGTWTFTKMRILAIFDDLDTILFMIPLKVAIVGLRWQLAVTLAVIVFLIALAWRFLHSVRLSTSWHMVLLYSAVIALLSEALYYGTERLFALPIHLEVLLPAFTLGCLLARPTEEEPKAADETAYTAVSAVFMLLVGLSMPPVISAIGEGAGGPLVVALHVLVITVLSNLGKMFPLFCYRKEASLSERLAVSVGMLPRGEVGAGILVLSLSLSIGKEYVTVAVLSLALNLVLTGVFIYIVKWLIEPEDAAA